MRPLPKLLFGTALALGLFASATFVGFIYEEQAPGSAASSAGDLIFLPSPQQARLMAVGFSNLVADYYWVKALQYFMDPAQGTLHNKNLGDYLDVVVGVDPDYEFAYKFAGLALPYDVGRFHYVNTRRSTGFLERAVARFPGNWQFHFYLGYNYLNYHHHPAKAAEQFEVAAGLPGSPTYLKGFTARVYAVSGDLDRAIAFATGTLETTTDPQVEALMKSRLIDLEVEKELQRIEAGAKAFETAQGKLPADLAELVASGFPAGPAGYSLDSYGVAHTELRAERMVLHDDPEQAGFQGE